jgi:hypothetical protein
VDGRGHAGQQIAIVTDARREAIISISILHLLFLSSGSRDS